MNRILLRKKAKFRAVLFDLKTFDWAANFSLRKFYGDLKSYSYLWSFEAEKLEKKVNCERTNIYLDISETIIIYLKVM